MIAFADPREEAGGSGKDRVDWRSEKISLEMFAGAFSVALQAKKLLLALESLSVTQTTGTQEQVTEANVTAWREARSLKQPIHRITEGNTLVAFCPVPRRASLNMGADFKRRYKRLLDTLNLFGHRSACI